MKKTILLGSIIAVFILLTNPILTSLTPAKNTNKINQENNSIMKNLKDSESSNTINPKFKNLSYNIYAIDSSISKLNSKKESITETHLIQGVPIIGQDSVCSCWISSHTMVLNYYGYNLSKSEIFYLMGGGFSLFYPPYRYLHPFPSVRLVYMPSNSEFIASLLNMEYQPFHVNSTWSKEKEWETAWFCIKENISMDQPVIIQTDASILVADNLGIKIPIEIWKKIPIDISHVVTIVGYNETNQSICYNDPQYNAFGHKLKGSYIWINKELFRISFEKFFGIYPSNWRIITYKKPVNTSFDGEQIMERGHTRNLKKLSGDYRYYYNDTDEENAYNFTKNLSFGINASAEIEKIFGDGLQTQIYTLLQLKKYSKFGIKNRVVSLFEDLMKRILDIDVSLILFFNVKGYKNSYKRIAEDKKLVSKFLMGHSNFSSKYNKCSNLLDNESKLWFKISDYFDTFLKKGYFISIPRGLYLLNKMKLLMKEIIKIEEEILSEQIHL